MECSAEEAYDITIREKTDEIGCKIHTGLAMQCGGRRGRNEDWVTGGHKAWGKENCRFKRDDADLDSLAGLTRKWVGRPPIL